MPTFLRLAAKRPTKTYVTPIAPVLPVSRAVVRFIEAGNDAVCEHCQLPVKFVARTAGPPGHRQRLHRRAMGQGGALPRGVLRRSWASRSGAREPEPASLSPQTDAPSAPGRASAPEKDLVDDGPIGPSPHHDVHLAGPAPEGQLRRQVFGRLRSELSPASPARPTVKCGTTSGNSPCQGGVSKCSASSVVKCLKGAAGRRRQPQHPPPEPAHRRQGVVKGPSGGPTALPAPRNAPA